MADFPPQIPRVPIARLTPLFGGMAPPRLGVCMEPIYKIIIYRYTLPIVGDAYAP